MSIQEHIDYFQKMGRTGSEAIAHLNALVKALDRTNWSSWQTTAGFDMELKQAREWIEQMKEQK